eukprot:1180817-Prorocentrum_minimum.AAC.2
MFEALAPYYEQYHTSFDIALHLQNRMPRTVARGGRVRTRVVRTPSWRSRRAGHRPAFRISEFPA